jgi:pantetheine-phosphate adenylyltransferase
MKRIAVFPGSFDPITIGHVDIIERAIPLFDEIIMAIGVNSSKKYMFSLEERQAHISATFANEPKIKQDTYSGLTIDYCKKIGANYLLRGMRSEHDFEFERSIALMNRAMASNVETVFLVSAPEFSAVSSTIVRDILRHGGNANQFIPKAIQGS